MKPTPEVARVADTAGRPGAAGSIEGTPPEPITASVTAPIADLGDATGAAADPGVAADSAAPAELDLLDPLGGEPWPGRISRAELVAQIVTLRDERDRALVALAHSRAREALAWESAHRDTLTGLPNRLGFEAAWQQALASHATGRRLFALLFIDLDGFKAINDRLGHAAGDELLTIVGARLAHALRRGDAVCRHGGDEFLCLLTQLRTPAEAHRIAEWLVHTIAAPCQLRQALRSAERVTDPAADRATDPPEVRLVSVQPSIGIALYPHDGRSAPALINRADAAMYRAKTQHLGLAGVSGTSAAFAASDLAVAAVLSVGPDPAESGPASESRATAGESGSGSHPPRQTARDGANARVDAAPAPHRSRRRLRNPD